MGGIAASTPTTEDQENRNHLKLKQLLDSIGRIATYDIRYNTATLNDVTSFRKLCSLSEKAIEFEFASALEEIQIMSPELRPLIRREEFPLQLDDQSLPEQLCNYFRTIQNEVQLPPNVPAQNWAAAEFRFRIPPENVSVWIENGPWIGSVAVHAEGWLLCLSRLLWAGAASLVTANCNHGADDIVVLRFAPRPVIHPRGIRGVVIGNDLDTTECQVVTSVWQRGWELKLRPVGMDLWSFDGLSRETALTTKQLASALVPHLFEQVRQQRRRIEEGGERSDDEVMTGALLGTATAAELHCHQDMRLSDKYMAGENLRCAVVAQLVRKAQRDEKFGNTDESCESGLRAMQLYLISYASVIPAMGGSSEDETADDSNFKEVWAVFFQAASNAIQPGIVLKWQQGGMELSPWRFWEVTSVVQKLCCSRAYQASILKIVCDVALSVYAMMRDGRSTPVCWEETCRTARTLPGQPPKLPETVASVTSLHVREWREFTTKMLHALLDTSQDDPTGEFGAIQSLIALNSFTDTSRIRQLVKRVAEAETDTLERAIQNALCRISLEEYSWTTHLAEFTFSDCFAKRLFCQPNARTELWRDLEGGEQRADTRETLWQSLFGSFASGGKLCTPRVEFLNLLEITECNFDDAVPRRMASDSTTAHSSSESVSREGHRFAPGDRHCNFLPLEVEGGERRAIDEVPQLDVKELDMQGLTIWYLKFCLGDDAFRWETAPFVWRDEREWKAMVATTCEWSDSGILCKTLIEAVAHAPSRNVITNICVQGSMPTPAFRVWNSTRSAGVSLKKIFDQKTFLG